MIPSRFSTSETSTSVNSSKKIDGIRKAARMSIVTMTIQLITNALWVSATAVGAIPYQLCSSPSTSRA